MPQVYCSRKECEFSKDGCCRTAAMSLDWEYDTFVRAACRAFVEKGQYEVQKWEKRGEDDACS